MDVARGSIARAEFLRRTSGVLAVVFFDRGHMPLSMRMPLLHPDPRPGITSERVLTAETAGKLYTGKVAQAYDAAHAYPEIFDGVACACGCSQSSGTHRSLLVCYETMQPTGCHSCQTEALLVGRLARAGKSLEEIRTAVDHDDG